MRNIYAQKENTKNTSYIMNNINCTIICNNDMKGQSKLAHWDTFVLTLMYICKVLTVR